MSGYPMDLALFNPIQIHLTANPQFIGGASDPYPNQSGMFEAGNQITNVSVPDELESRALSLAVLTQARSRSKSGCLDPVEAIREPETGLAIDGREQLMFLLSNRVMPELVTAEKAPSEDALTEELWARSCQEADITAFNELGLCTIADAWSVPVAV